MSLHGGFVSGVIFRLCLSTQSGIDCWQEPLGDDDENTARASGMWCGVFLLRGRLLALDWRSARARGLWRRAAQVCGIIRMRNSQSGCGWVFVLRCGRLRVEYRVTSYKQCWRSCASEWELDYHVVLKLCFATLLVNLITNKKKTIHNTLTAVCSGLRKALCDMNHRERSHEFPSAVN
jgi:hypothetical protein